jgi:RNA 2',3'-cyclic 3'-phosphodiesterase
VAHLAEFIGSLAITRANAPGRSTRLADPSRWHITLAFLGQVPADRAGLAAGAVSRATSRAPSPITVRLAGGGRFGRGRFVVLWVAVSGQTDALAALSRLVRRELRRARLPEDDKPFRPHLTVARPGARLNSADLAADVVALRGYEGPQWAVRHVHLVSSELGPQPEHTRLSSFRLSP